MANEIVVLEYKKPSAGDGSSIGGSLVTSQYLDYNEASAACNAATSYVIIMNVGSTACAIKQGGSDVSAALNTAGNIPLAGGAKTDPLPVSEGLNYFDSSTS